jgi:hypothetical protein
LKQNVNILMIERGPAIPISDLPKEEDVRGVHRSEGWPFYKDFRGLRHSAGIRIAKFEQKGLVLYRNAVRGRDWQKTGVEPNFSRGGPSPKMRFEWAASAGKKLPGWTGCQL